MAKEHKTHYKNIKIKKLPHSEVEISGEIEAEALEDARKQAIKNLGENADLPGFRKGHIPEAVLISKVGEMGILEEAAEIVLSHEYQHIIIDNKIDVIGRPQIALTKIARGNDLGFKLTVPVFPEIKLPDYKKLAKAEMKVKDEIVVGDEDVEKVIHEIQRSYAAESAAEETKKTGVIPAKADGTKESSASLPEIDNEFVKKLGDFADVADFKKKLRENIYKEKESRHIEKKRLKLGEALVGETTAELPAVLVQSELEKMKGQFMDDLSRMGITYEAYLKEIKKTEDEMKKDWEKDAEKRVIMQILLNKIALEEKLVPDKTEVEKETEHILSHYKDADRERVRVHVETMLTNEKVFQFLETQK